MRKRKATRWLLTLVVCVVVFAFVACDGGRSREMTAVLDRAQQQNLDYDSITNVDSIALAAKFFDRHGTPNQQMRAYYLLGCAHRDMGEAPAALDLYHEAANRADTLSNDCNYALLCRVYSQMAIIFYKQNLLADNLSCLEQSIVYARRAGDTIAALNSYAQKVGAFDRLDMTDSVLIVCKNTYHGFSKIGNKQLASGYLSVAIKHLIRKGNLEEAKSCMDIYEAESGYFNSSGDIESGREIYYHIKGEYYLQKELYDSAEYYFRKELKHGHDFNNQNAGSRDLALLYSQVNKSDSAAKYALYSYAMNDSVYAKMATREVEQVQALYNYSRHQRTAERESARSARLKSTIWISGLLGATILLSLLFVIYVLRNRSKSRLRLMASRYAMDMLSYQETTTKLHLLKSQQDKDTELIALLEAERDVLRKALASQQPDYKEPEEWGLQDSLLNSPIVTHFHKQATTGATVTESEWNELRKLVNELMPQFMSAISSFGYQPNQKETNICILEKLRFAPSEQAALLGVTKGAVTNMFRRLSEKLFGKEQSAKEFHDIISSLPYL